MATNNLQSNKWYITKNKVGNLFTNLWSFVYGSINPTYYLYQPIRLKKTTEYLIQFNYTTSSDIVPGTLLYVGFAAETELASSTNIQVLTNVAYETLALGVSETETKQLFITTKTNNSAVFFATNIADSSWVKITNVSVKEHSFGGDIILRHGDGDVDGAFKFMKDDIVGGILDFDGNTSLKTYTFPDRSLTIDNITTATTTNGTGFVKGNGSVVSFDNSTYLTSLSGAVLTSQASPQTVGDTTNRLLKLWATDITCTNAITGGVTGNAGTVTNATLTTALTVNTGTVTLTGNVANTSALTIGAGAVSVSGANTGDQTTLTGISDTKANFNTACSDGTFLYVGDAPTSHASSHAVGAADTVFPVDPNADKYLMWDDDPGALAWVDAPAPEGTAVKSTGEAGGTKFLREDGDGTCSWQELVDINTPSNSLYRQAIINGNFDVWQRGTSFASTASTKDLADRWTDIWGVAGRTISRQSAGLDGSNYCMRIARDSGNANTDTKYYVYRGLESNEGTMFRNKIITVSFWARKGADYSATSSVIAFQTKTGTGTNETFASSGAFATGSATVIDQSSVLTTSWQKFTYSSSALGATVTQISLLFGTTPTGTAGAADYYEIAQVQLNTGSVALSFQPKSYADELRDCQRYCYGITTVSTTEEVAQGMAVSTTVSYPSITLPVTMRILPTIATATATDWQLDDGINAPTDVTALVIDDLGFSNTRKVVLKASAASGLTAYRPYYLVGDGNAGRIFVISAEL